MILITGATGLLGSYLVEDLLKKGFSLKLLIRKEEQKKQKKTIDKEVEGRKGQHE